MTTTAATPRTPARPSSRCSAAKSPFSTGGGAPPGRLAGALSRSRRPDGEQAAGRGRLGLVEGALQGLDVAGACIARAAHRVDLAALRGKGLAGQLGDGGGVDRGALAAVVGLLQHRDLGDLGAVEGDLYLHGAV